MIFHIHFTLHIHIRVHHYTSVLAAATLRPYYLDSTSHISASPNSKTWRAVNTCRLTADPATSLSHGSDVASEDDAEERMSNFSKNVRERCSKGPQLDSNRSDDGHGWQLNP